MRLDARKGDCFWRVYHAERCEMLKAVLWIDDEIRQWCEWIYPLLDADKGGPLTRVCSARRIEIMAESKLVIINPVGDDVDDVKRAERELVA